MVEIWDNVKGVMAEANTLMLVQKSKNEKTKQSEV